MSAWIANLPLRRKLLLLCLFGLMMMAAPATMVLRDLLEERDVVRAEGFGGARARNGLTRTEMERKGGDQPVAQMAACGFKGGNHGLRHACIGQQIATRGAIHALRLAPQAQHLPPGMDGTAPGGIHHEDLAVVDMGAPGGDLGQRLRRAVEQQQDLDPHLADVGFFQPEDHPSEGRIRRTKLANTFSGGAREDETHAPRTGEHTREVLADLGYDTAQIDAWIDGGIASSSDKS